MPMYDFYCEDCKNEFSIEMKVSDYEQSKEAQTCPSCGSSNVSRKIAEVEVQTSKKS